MVIKYFKEMFDAFLNMNLSIQYIKNACCEMFFIWIIEFLRKKKYYFQIYLF